MKWEIIVVGKPSLPWARAGVEDYVARLKRMASLEIKILRESPASDLASRMLAASAGNWRVALDERGKMMGSEDFAKWIAQQELGSRKRVSVLIGGADGHSKEVREEADEVWSLSPMTLQHELALVVFLEQVYRACSILRGEPYHRK